jgi:hypothetical protein
MAADFTGELEMMKILICLLVFFLGTSGFCQDGKISFSSDEQMMFF